MIFKAPVRLFLGLASTLSAVQTALAAPVSPERQKFFDDRRMYYVRIQNWDQNLMTPQALEKERVVEDSTFEIFLTEPSSGTHCPDNLATNERRVYGTKLFGMKTSGNKTKGLPKSSYKVKFAKKERFLGMSSLNLKSMWNDVSQMREALAWSLFAKAGVPSSGHTYAKFCINGRYFGLYSVIEEVDKSFLEDRFDKNSKGNLYKGYWLPEDIGPATLAYRRAQNGDDSGRMYKRNPNPGLRTYELKTNEDKDDPPQLQTYDDLALFIKTLNAGDPASDEFRREMERIFDVETFLRWAAVNVLLGAWDNYWATPANYYVYNSGPEGAAKAFMTQPYFRWIPWDYDNSFGITYFSTQWQYADILDWAASTKTYNQGRKLSEIPLITRLLANPTYRDFYLDQVERLLKTDFTPGAIARDLDRLTKHVEKAAFLESDSPQGAPHTGRRFTNDQVYWNGFQHHELKGGGQLTWGILHYVKMRSDSARQQLIKHRARRK